MWLRSTKTQQKYNVQAILNSSKTKLPLIKVSSDFVDSRPNRRNDFGVFAERILNNDNEAMPY